MGKSNKMFQGKTGNTMTKNTSIGYTIWFNKTLYRNTTVNMNPTH